MVKKPKIIAPVTTHARHDRAHILAPGLFLSVPKGGKDEKRHIKYEFSKGMLIEFQCFSQLGVRDMRVLQGLVAIAGPHGAQYDRDKTSPAGQSLARELFKVQTFGQKSAAIQPPANLDLLMVRDSLRRLAQEIGMSTSGPSLNLIKESIERLFAVTIFFQSDGRRIGTRLLSSYESDEGTGDLYIALNPLIAAAVLGNSQYAHFDMVEARALKTDPARLIHQRLSGWLDCGKSAEVSIETLCGYVWHEDPSIKAGTLRFRKARIREALLELSALGWVSDEVKSGIYRITRPAINFDLVRSIANAGA